MEFLDKRILGICNELKKLSVRQKAPIDQWQYKEGNYIHPSDAQNDPTPFTAFDCQTMHWYGPDKHYWFKAECEIPANFDGKPLWMNLRTQIDEWDDGKNPQFLLFLDGTPIQGVDMNHRDVLLTRSAAAGETHLIELQSYTGTLHSEFNLLVDLQEIDPEIEGLYYDLNVPLSAFPRMDAESRSRMDLERVLNDAINLLDLRTPYSAAFDASILAARAYLAKHLYEDLAGHDEIIASCIGHTHIDVAWWWTVEQTREKVGRSFATVLKLMDEYPNYKFMSSQPQLYVFLKERYPELYAQVKERIKEGRWEPEGGMWVEADCNLASGESLVRQFIHGKRFFKDEFGVDNRILWLPDVFGYSGALPQIMRKSGIDYFMTTKLAWNQFNKVPHDTFNWRGIDGSEVFTHLITTVSIGQDEKKNFFTTYNGMLHPDALMGGWSRYQDKAINNDILVAYGYGDGGGGPTREMLETSTRMEKGIAGLPKVRQAFSRTYFDELFERAGDNKRLFTWEGELYFEYHRGTYTSMARNKRSNRKGELHLMDLELLSVLSVSALPYPTQDLDAMWKVLLINQFHDILPGSSIKEVYEVTKREYAELEEKIAAMQQERFEALCPASENITVFNTKGFDSSEVVTIADSDFTALKGADGSLYPAEKTADGMVCSLKNLPSKGYTTYTPVHDSISVTSPFIRTGSHKLETPYYTLELDENALFSRLFDKENDREVLQQGKKGNLMRVYEDKPIYYDNWDIDIFYTEKYWDVLELESMEWIDEGAVRTTLTIERKVSNSLIRQKIHFYADSRRIDFETYVDWKEHQHLLKVHFPVDVHTDEATFDIQFGNLTRKVHQNTSWDVARFESCGHKWMDLSEGHYGVSMLNDCKYGHSVKDSNMALTLIKSGIEPNLTTDQEEHFFTYALYPHAEGWRQAGTVLEAYKLNQPAIAAMGGNASERFSLAKTAHANAMLETIKLAEDGDGYIARIYETDNARTQSHLTWNMPIASVEECNLVEEKMADVSFADNSIPFTIKPYEIKTFRIRCKE
ncbi:MAG: alpha-mannosidase [Clostridiales bacterium]|nr:alpha-mannosidase [Clostridiales bacterium]